MKEMAEARLIKQMAVGMSGCLKGRGLLPMAE
jgi:hypothetical protein